MARSPRTTTTTRSTRSTRSAPTRDTVVIPEPDPTDPNDVTLAAVLTGSLVSAQAVAEALLALVPVDRPDMVSFAISLVAQTDPSLHQAMANIGQGGALAASTRRQGRAVASPADLTARLALSLASASIGQALALASAPDGADLVAAQGQADGLVSQYLSALVDPTGALAVPADLTRMVDRTHQALSARGRGGRPGQARNTVGGRVAERLAGHVFTFRGVDVTWSPDGWTIGTVPVDQADVDPAASGQTVGFPSTACTTIDPSPTASHDGWTALVTSDGLTADAIARTVPADSDQADQA